MTFYSIVLHFHSILRYFVLLLLIITIFKSLRGIRQGLNYNKSDQRFALLTMVSFHFQLLVGLILYFVSPKVLFSKAMLHFDMFRFFTMEHISLMLIAIALVTTGYIKTKQSQNTNGYMKILVFYTLSLILVLLAIPWPIRINLGGAWF